MTYHDKNRLIAHTKELKLTATQLAVAKELADSLKLKNGSIQLPASYLAKQIGRTEKTTQLAIRALLDLGIFEATQPSPYNARTFKMAERISCPDSCLHLEAHNSPIRLKRLAIRAREAQKLTGNSYPQEAQLTGNLDQLTGNHYLTNRDIDIDDIEQQLFRSIEITKGLLNDLGELTAKQVKLNSWLNENPGSVEARIRHLASKSPIRDLSKWLLAIIQNNTETLYRHLEQTTKTTKQALKEKQQTATIYKELPGSHRITKSRLAKYCLDLFGLKITPVSSNYLLKRGAGISSKDLELAKYFEAIASDKNITKIDPNQRLQLELIDNEITASYLDIDGTSFNWELLNPQEIITWGILEANELELHLEAEKLEQELFANYLEANPEKTRPKAYVDLQPELQAIRAKYPRISPQEARKRYTKVFSEFINNFYNALPEQPIEALDTWLNSNYTQLNDYQELIAEHYPEKPESMTWSEQAGFTAYLEALGKGYTWDKLARAMDNYRESLGSTWSKAPNTWLNGLMDLRQQAKAIATPGERAGEATGLENILGAMTRPNSN
jgi:hypothetical protein